MFGLLKISLLPAVFKECVANEGDARTMRGRIRLGLEEGSLSHYTCNPAAHKDLRRSAVIFEPRTSNA